MLTLELAVSDVIDVGVSGEHLSSENGCNFFAVVILPEYTCSKKHQKTAL